MISGFQKCNLRPRYPVQSGLKTSSKLMPVRLMHDITKMLRYNSVDLYYNIPLFSVPLVIVCNLKNYKWQKRKGKKYISIIIDFLMDI